MWEKIKNDPLIKTIVVILLGVLAFGFAFNIMFGSGSSSMEDGSMMSSGYSLSNTLGNLIELLIQLVIISLLIGVIVWIFKAITKQSVTGQNDRYSWLKEDPIIKNTLIISGSVLVFLFGLSYLRRIATTGTGEEMMNTGTSSLMLSSSFNLTSLLVFLLKILILVFFVVLVYVIIMYFKENYSNVSYAKDMDAEQNASKECPDCKAKVKAGWKCCPYCGSDKISDIIE